VRSTPVVGQIGQFRLLAAALEWPTWAVVVATYCDKRVSLEKIGFPLQLSRCDKVFGLIVCPSESRSSVPVGPRVSFANCPLARKCSFRRAALGLSLLRRCVALNSALRQLLPSDALRWNRLSQALQCALCHRSFLSSRFVEPRHLIAFPSFPFRFTRAVDIILTLSPSEMVAHCRDCSRSVEVTMCARE